MKANFDLFEYKRSYGRTNLSLFNNDTSSILQFFEFPFRQRRTITLWFEENANDTFAKGRLLTTGHKFLYILQLALHIYEIVNFIG